MTGMNGQGIIAGCNGNRVLCPALAPPDKVQDIGLDHPGHIGNALAIRMRVTLHVDRTP